MSDFLVLEPKEVGVRVLFLVRKDCCMVVEWNRSNELKWKGVWWVVIICRQIIDPVGEEKLLQMRNKLRSTVLAVTKNL